MDRRLRLIFMGFVCCWVAIAIPSSLEFVSASTIHPIFVPKLNSPIQNLQDKTGFSPFQRTLAFSQGFESLADGENARFESQLDGENTGFISQSDGENTSQLVQQAREAYDNEDYQNAASLLEQAVAIFQEQGEDLRRAIALSNLSLAYQQLGEWNKAEKAISASIELLKTQDDSEQNLSILARAYNIQGRLRYEKGQSEKALEDWKEATRIHEELGNLEGIISSKINQIQALQALGLYRQARDILGEIEGAIAQLPDSIVKIRALRSFGDLLRAMGELDTRENPNNCQVGQSETRCDAEDILQESLKVAERVKQSASPSEIPEIHSEIGAVWLSLGNTLRAKGNLVRDRASTSINFDYLPWQYQRREEIPKNAQQFYEEAAVQYRNAIATPSIATATKIKAQLNLLSLFVEGEQSSEIDRLKRSIEIDKLPQSRASVYAKVSLAKSLAFWQQKDQNFNDRAEIEELLERALQEARSLKDERAESYVLGNIGGFYEYLAGPEEPHQSQQNLKSESQQKAVELTQKALNLIQPLAAPDLAYQWQWQLGRLLVEQGKTESAIATYQTAVNSLELIRSDLLAINPEIQFSFRDNVEPLYRQLVDLILSPEKINSPSLTQSLEQVIKIIDSLQLAELENFLGCDLGQFQDLDRNEPDPNAATIYPILLKNRLAIIFDIPGQQPRLGYRETEISYSEIARTLRALGKALEISGNTPEVLEEAEKVYQWVIKPLDPVLERNRQIQTLVFVLDGELRNIPMGVLYDGEQYLLQKDYAIAVAPRLKLFAPKPIEQKLNIFLGGVNLFQTIAGREFESIERLEEELDGIIAEPIATGELILNERFTKANIRQQFQTGNFSAIHWKTHGVFSSNPEETYIVAYEDIIAARDLSTLIQTDRAEPLELLVLSACETAKGDRRAVLGLAGIAVQSGARSAISTLWKADDAANTELMVRFYQQLSQGKSKGRALREAQLSLLNAGYSAPHLWATYILVGNWL